MKTPRDIMSDAPLYSDAEHARRATTLRRLAGGVRAQQAAGALGLNEEERKLLADAADMLDRMADTSKKAAVLAKQRATDLTRREKLVGEAMRTNFRTLSSVADQVALIGSVNAYVLQGQAHYVSDRRGLREQFAEAIESLTYILARKAETQSPASVVEAAWGTFKAQRVAFQAKYQRIIDTLSAADAT